MTLPAFYNACKYASKTKRNACTMRSRLYCWGEPPGMHPNLCITSFKSREAKPTKEARICRANQHTNAFHSIIA